MGGDLSVTCPVCHTSGHVPRSYEGREITCKKCGGHFVAQAIEESHSFDDDCELAPLAPDEEQHARERYEARVLSKNRAELHEHDHDHNEAHAPAHGHEGRSH
jgi:transcription initiation factor TFIIIB Brf1 subunit/transcription initiation factor TFIIB